MTPDPNTPGTFQKVIGLPRKPGSYTAEVTAQRGDEDLGRDVLNFQRDGWRRGELSTRNRIAICSKSFRHRPAGDIGSPRKFPAWPIRFRIRKGITVREAKDLWNMPIIFILLLLLPTTEWLPRLQVGDQAKTKPPSPSASSASPFQRRLRGPAFIVTAAGLW